MAGNGTTAWDRAKFPEDAYPVLFVFDCGCEWYRSEEEGFIPDMDTVTRCMHVMADTWAAAGFPNHKVGM